MRVGLHLRANKLKLVAVALMVAPSELAVATFLGLRRRWPDSTSVRPPMGGRIPPPSYKHESGARIR